MNYHNRLLILCLIGILSASCSFFEENKPIQSPGLGINIKNNTYHIYFDVGILTFENDEISRETIEKLFHIVIQELEKQWNDIKLHPVFDQPQDGPFLMERVVSKKLNPYIETFRLKKKYLYHNNFIIEEIPEEENSKEPEKFFLSSQLHHFLYSQVRYDVLIIPFAILSDFDYNNKRRETEINHIELGLAKGRTALDKMGIIIHLDYTNPVNQQNIMRLKQALISLILALPIEISNNFLEKNCKECDQYLRIRKNIFTLYFDFNKGKIKEGCKNLAKYWIEWQSFPYIEEQNKVLKKQIEENFEILKKRCKN
ncbi:MAG: hypothetical protein KatS3mg129_2992 [Leptospiraceae bacterium]|nr:MAG: hypothetical protein KatS3mg129_2992 [Leptospiraceae bacterium]